MVKAKKRLLNLLENKFMQKKILSLLKNDLENVELPDKPFSELSITTASMMQPLKAQRSRIITLHRPSSRAISTLST